jgi:membrane protein DedA with SNARE-associated domain/rhodanese-related sulfurtransferase
MALPLLIGATAMCVLADVAWFVAGRRYGSRILQLLCRVSLTPDICASDTLVRFDSWGANALILAKFIPGISLLAPPVAGALQMRWRTFLTRTTVVSFVWVSLFLGGGYLFNRQIRQLIPRMIQFKPLIIPTLAVIAGLYIAYKWWERRRLRAAMSASRVSVADTNAMLLAQLVPVIVDVRSHTARALDPWQIPRSLHIVPGEISKRVHELPLDRDVILYCTCPNDASAAQVAGWLIRSGRPRARTLHGGLPAWREAGNPLESILPVASGLSGQAAPT